MFYYTATHWDTSKMLLLLFQWHFTALLTHEEYIYIYIFFYQILHFTDCVLKVYWYVFQVYLASFFPRILLYTGSQSIVTHWNKIVQHQSWFCNEKCNRKSSLYRVNCTVAWSVNSNIRIYWSKKQQSLRDWTMSKQDPKDKAKCI